METIIKITDDVFKGEPQPIFTILACTMRVKVNLEEKIGAFEVKYILCKDKEGK